ncbi:Fibronectin type III domain containing protein, putative [Angomonas deanei]|uniref:Fibronectin type III domain containing protein, putative n=1 Tax=Angomonas deanei TaxID=59799 RepID=A0A7G2CS86_9TRYP|nr:Fibronectin type III domain containing protein, putative [Angomonas deanei]
MGDFAPTLTCSTLSSLSLSATPVQNQIRIQFGRPTFRNVDFAESLTDGSALPTVVRYDVRVCLTELSERVFLSSMNASVEEKERKSRRSMCVFSKVFDSDDVFSTKEIRYTITDLEIDTCYTVGVRSMDATGVWCDWVMREVFTPPVAPSNVALYRASPHVASLQWQPIGPRGVYRYCVECYYVADPATGNKKSAPEWREVDQVELHVCGFRLSGPFSRLRCRVRSIRTDCLNRPASEHSYSEYSPTVSVSEGSPPVGVEQLQVAVLSRNSATIEWTSSHANTKKTSFKVYLSSKGGHLTLVSTEQHSVVVLRDLLPMTEYVTEIVAQNNNGISHNNPRIRFTTKAENDSTTTYYEEGMPSLGSVALPGEKDKSSRLIPAPPSKSAKGSTRSSRMSNLLKPESSGSSFAADGPVRSSSRNFSEQRPRSSRTHTIQKSISKPRPSTTTGRDAEGSARTSRLY